MSGSATYAKRRALGLCGTCGKVKSKTSKCDVCKKRELDKKKARYDQRKADGLCPTCGDPASADKVLCSKCSNKNDGASRRYYRNKAAGVCRVCGKDAGGLSRCTKCATKQVDYARQRYKRRKELGVCYQCGVQPSSGERTTCDDCAEKQSNRSKRRWQRLRKQAMDAYGGPRCSGCEEDDPEVLEIDHINGGGNEHRREIGQSNIYLWLRENGYPEGFRVLCPTCNKKAARGIRLPLNS